MHAQVTDHPLERVSGIDGDPVSGFDAGFLQSARDPLGLSVQLVAREVSIAGAEHDIGPGPKQLIGEVARAQSAAQVVKRGRGHGLTRHAAKNE